MASRHCPTLAGFSLLELLIVIAVIAILAATVLPTDRLAVDDQLQAAAQIMAGDLALARSLAVTNSSTYQIAFDADGGTYTLSHAGDDHALDTLPRFLFSDSGNSSNQYVVRFSDLPGLNTGVRIAGAGALGGSSWTRVADVEFGPLGQTSRCEPTTVFLAVGSGPSARYVPLSVNSVTGLATIGQMMAEPPPATVSY